mmetsp:Transcript_14643/g.35506  ORF Transcript_14643/g.35506 Transcript_14643/m.35506 type:complete len:286 (+) Transcript_14643:644-1501(+)
MHLGYRCDEALQRSLTRRASSTPYTSIRSHPFHLRHQSLCGGSGLSQCLHLLDFLAQCINFDGHLRINVVDLLRKPIRLGDGGVRAPFRKSFCVAVGDVCGLLQVAVDSHVTTDYSVPDTMDIAEQSRETNLNGIAIRSISLFHQIGLRGVCNFSSTGDHCPHHFSHLRTNTRGTHFDTNAHRSNHSIWCSRAANLHVSLHTVRDKLKNPSSNILSRLLCSTHDATGAAPGDSTVVQVGVQLAITTLHFVFCPTFTSSNLARVACRQLFFILGVHQLVLSLRITD